MTDTYITDGLEIEYSYSPYEPPERRAANGDPPQYPGSDECIEIENVFIEGASYPDGTKCDISYLLSTAKIDELAEEILEHIHEMQRSRDDD